MPPPMYQMYPPNRMYPMQYMPPPQYYPQPYYYEQPYYKPEDQEIQYPQSSDAGGIHDLLKDVLAADIRDTGNEKKPVKSGEGREEDILSQLLGNESKLVREN